MKKLDNYSSNLRVLEKAKDEDITNEFIKSGIIDKFYIQFELAWKTLKEYLKYEGVKEAATGSPRDIIKAAYRYYGCIEEEKWLDMLSERNDTAHIYNKEAADRLVNKILDEYVAEFGELESFLQGRYGDEG